MRETSVVVGISGGSGSGKTELARRLAAEIPHCAVLEADAYYQELPRLDPKQRALANFDHPDSLDWDLLIEHLRALRHGKTIERPIWDFSIHGRSPDTCRIRPARVIIMEGIFSLVNPTLREELDVAVFVDTPLDICLMRILHRDVLERQATLESVLRRYADTVRPMFFEHILPSQDHADIVVHGHGETDAALKVIRTRVLRLLG